MNSQNLRKEIKETTRKLVEAYVLGLQREHFSSYDLKLPYDKEIKQELYTAVFTIGETSDKLKLTLELEAIEKVGKRFSKGKNYQWSFMLFSTKDHLTELIYDKDFWKRKSYSSHQDDEVIVNLAPERSDDSFLSLSTNNQTSRTVQLLTCVAYQESTRRRVESECDFALNLPERADFGKIKELRGQLNEMLSYLPKSQATSVKDKLNSIVSEKEELTEALADSQLSEADREILNEKMKISFNRKIANLVDSLD